MFLRVPLIELYPDMALKIVIKKFIYLNISIVFQFITVIFQFLLLYSLSKMLYTTLTRSNLKL